MKSKSTEKKNANLLAIDGDGKGLSGSRTPEKQKIRWNAIEESQKEAEE